MSVSDRMLDALIQQEPFASVDSPSIPPSDAAHVDGNRVVSPLAVDKPRGFSVMSNDATPAPQRAPAESGSTAIPPSLSDPFDLDALRLSQNFGATVGTKRVITTVPVQKPNKQVFVRVRPGEEWRLQTLILELKQERETYLIAPALREGLLDELKPVVLFAAITRQGSPFLWPVKLPSSDGRTDSWSSSALQAAELATKTWVRVSANMSLGAYDVYEATGAIPEPEWLDLTLQDLVKVAFRDRYIDSSDHPVLRGLRGAA